MNQNEIYATIVHSREKAVTRPAWLHDYGMILKINGIDLPNFYEVDFSNSRTEHAVRRIGDADGVQIPDSLFYSGKQIYCWLYLHNTEDDGFTVYEIEVPLRQRPAVTDVEPTPHQQDIVEQAISALSTAVAQTSADVETTTQAKNQAVAAKDTAVNAKDIVVAARAEVVAAKEAFENTYTELSALSGMFAQDGEVTEDGLFYFLNNGQRIAGPFGPFAGGGGGGGGSTTNAKMEAKNVTGWNSKTISVGGEVTLAIEWSSIEDEMPTGTGTVRIYVKNVLKQTATVEQGTVYISVGQFLSAGSNTVRVTVSDIYDQTKQFAFVINAIELRLSSSFDATVPYSGSINFPFVPTGRISKTVVFKVDGTQIGTMKTSVSGSQLSYLIPAQTHGSHKLEVFFISEIDSEFVESNHLLYDLICAETGETATIISSSFFDTATVQYTTLNIPYIVYNPASATAAVTISANGETIATLPNVDRTVHTLTYRALEDGELTISISSGGTVKTFNLTVSESAIDVEAVTQDLSLYLSSQGRSNAEANPGTWVYGNIEAVFSDFNFVSDGWVNDEDGVTVCRVAGDARLTIPYQAFAQDFRTGGKTIEVEFATRNVLNYDAVVMSCLSGGRGFSLTAQAARLASEQSAISMQYKEDEHVRVSFVVEKRSENRLIYIYVNGVMSGAVQYPADDDFSQVEPVGITVGSNDCTIDLYCIRVYDNDLTRKQVLDNWIADTQSIDTLVDRYARNNVYDEYGVISIEKLPAGLPYMIVSAAELPQYKGDKKTVSVQYVDPVTAAKSFTAENVTFNVQGTSSQYYERKNYKAKFNGGFVMASGQTAQKYAMRADSVPTKTFTFKADVASSEGANNVELARLYNDSCVYKTPAQEEDPAIRQGIDGFPIVMFWDNGTETTFLGKYNFNNDKGTEEVFGFEGGDESWEVLNNTSDRVIWKNADYSGTDWQNDFEARYPDTDPAYTDSSQLAEFAAWLVSTDRGAATSETLTQSYTDIDGNVHTVDNAAYRLAKFKTEAQNYMEMDSAFFYYLFTELFLMVDSRAKNMFPSFMGTEVVGE